jgi:hypothetical protein
MEKITIEEPIHELPEIVLTRELSEKYEYKPSADTFYWSVIAGEHFGKEEAAELLLAQKKELPFLVSAVMERTCNLNCAHCLYQNEKSSAELSQQMQLDKVIANIVSQMPASSAENLPSFMSAGRILQVKHLELFEKLRSIRPDVRLGLIDNGTYTRLLRRWPEGFKFDWVDISIDGPEAIHNRQRESEGAFQQALNGLKQARHIVRAKEDGGRVTSLFTLTKINSASIAETADLVLGGDENSLQLADWFGITTMSPTNVLNKNIEVDSADFEIAWEEIKNVAKKYNAVQKQNFGFHIYNTEHIEKLAAVIGEKKFMEAFGAQEGSPLTVKRNFLATVIDGVPVSYQPLSIWTPEEFLIEADGAQRTAFEGSFTLEELRSGRAKDGRETTKYTVSQLTPASNFKKEYENGVDHFWRQIGKKEIEKEIAAWGRIREKAK